MKNLNKLIREWQDRGLITSDQVHNILDYENKKPKASWFMYGIITLGVSVVGLGLVSLIAANWHQISDGVKLGGAFVLLSIISIMSYKTHGSGKLLIYDSLVLGLQAASLATIGLIAQIYHSGGRLEQAILFWSLICLPSVLTTNFMFSPFIWVGGLTGSLLFFLGDMVIKPPQFVPLLAPLISAIITLSAKRLGASDGFLKASHAWLLVSVMCGLLACEAFGARPLSDPTGLSNFSQVFYFLSILILVFIWSNKSYVPLQKSLLTALVIIYAFSSQLKVPALKGEILFATLTLLQLGLIGAFFASEKARRRFNFILILMGLRFFGLFIQALQGLALTGFGLILSGALLIALATIWQKHRSKISLWAERITQ